MDTFDIQEFKNIIPRNNRYEQRLSILKNSPNSVEIENIDSTVKESIVNINQGVKSFVIYGEPQSGKTEMMIALTAKLLDIGFKIIVVLLNDNVRLLNQNLDRFRRSGIDPSPVNFNEILEENIGDRSWVIFSKKNPHDLRSLLDKLAGKSNKVIIDDEADFASPNGLVNKNDRTTINFLIHKLLQGDSIYIGVTATPARLDLNNTFDNITEKWVNFKPHKEYVGKDTFFPVIQREKLDYRLKLLSNKNDSPTYLQDALLSFLTNVAILNLTSGQEKNYCFLVHTSGKTADHRVDQRTVINIFDILSDENDRNYERMVKRLYAIAEKKNYSPKEVVKYVLTNIAKKTVTVLNSDKEKKGAISTDPTNPPSLFTVAIGGNIVSRGVTFNNLLSMFFTRDVKHKMQQDTYIQRARMFGNRGGYINFFELWIPEDLYMDWQKCFVYHYLSLESIKNSYKAPVWIADNRIQPIAKNSVDNKTVVIDGGEMSFKKFTYSKGVEDTVKNDDLSNFEKLQKINDIIGGEVIPRYVISFIKHYSPNGNVAVAIHDIRDVKRDSDYHDDLYRKKGIFGGREISDFPQALHHILILKNTENIARAVYKYIGNVVFFKNLGVSGSI